MKRRILLLALAAGAALPLVPLRAEDAPQGKILYTRKEGDRSLLHVMNADGTNDMLLPGQTGNVHMFPTVSPDGKRVAYMVGDKPEGNEFKVGLCNIDGTDHKTLPINEPFVALPAFSPDGKHLAYVAGNMQTNGAAVYVADVNGANPKQISPAGKMGFFPFWLDAKRVGYTSGLREEPKADLYISSLDGGEPEKITAVDTLVFTSAHGGSPDGKQLLYTVFNMDDKSATVKSMGLADKTERTLFQLTLGDNFKPETFPSPAWAPDGKSFLITMATEKGAAIYRCSPDGQTRTRVSPEDATCSGAVWFTPAK